MCDDPAQYIDTDQRMCENCNNTLQFCTHCEDPFQCLTCADAVHAHLVDGMCRCDDGFYPASTACVECSAPGCQLCRSADNCTQCNGIAHWILVESVCMCQPGFAQVGEKCEMCSTGCLVCDQDINCLVCDAANHWAQDGVGGCMC